MSAAGKLRRNPFWPVITKECYHAGYKQVTSEETKRHLVAVIHGFGPNGLPSTQRYLFPRTFKAIESLRNFKSQFRNFLRYELPDRGFFPGPDHRTRRPGGTIAHICHDIPKKKLATPRPVLAELCAMQPSMYEGLVCAPYIPEDRPAEPARKVDPAEPVSDSKVLAVFLVDSCDLGTVIEATQGTARFRGSRPAPLRILGQADRAAAAAIAAAPPASTVPTAPPPARPFQVSEIVRPQSDPQQPGRIRRVRMVPGMPLAERIVERINSDRKRQWRHQDLHDLSASANSIGPTLSVLAAGKRIQRVSRGVYVAAMTQ